MRLRIKGFLINKFRGDTTLFHDGMNIIADATGWQGLGILPWFEQARSLPAEDILDLETKADRGGENLPCMSLCRYCGGLPISMISIRFRLTLPIRLSLVQPGAPLPLDADMVLLPGSKSTLLIWHFCAIRAGILTSWHCIVLVRW